MGRWKRPKMDIWIYKSDSFFKCSSLIKDSLPSSITMIGKGAFSGCLSLREIEIPSSVISIGDHAFDGCSKLVKIKIPSSSLPVRRSRTWCCALPPVWWSWQASGRCYSRPLSWRKWRSRSSSIGGVFPAEKLLPRALSSLLHVCLESGWSSMMRPFCSLRSHSPQGPWIWWLCTSWYPNASWTRSRRHISRRWASLQGSWKWCCWMSFWFHQFTEKPLRSEQKSSPHPVENPVQMCQALGAPYSTKNRARRFRCGTFWQGVGKLKLNWSYQPKKLLKGDGIISSIPAAVCLFNTDFRKVGAFHFMRVGQLDINIQRFPGGHALHHQEPVVQLCLYIYLLQIDLLLEGKQNRQFYFIFFVMNASSFFKNINDLKVLNFISFIYNFTENCIVIFIIWKSTLILFGRFSSTNKNCRKVTKEKLWFCTKSSLINRISRQ